MIFQVKMELRNIPAVTQLLRVYLSHYVVAPDLDENDVDLMQLIDDYFCQYCTNFVSTGKLAGCTYSKGQTRGQIHPQAWHQKGCVIPTSKEKKESSRQARST